jgi:hypothetical protein
MFSPNPNSKLGALFAPGVLDTKFLMYLGYRGSTGTGTPNFILNNEAALLQFTGYVQTDSNAQVPKLMDKTVSLIDLTTQFKFQVNDTFPHPLYGDQTLTYFDPTYNLTNPSADGKTYVCDGKMFTLDSTSKVFGSTHIDPQVYVDITGTTPQSVAVVNTPWTLTGTLGSCANYTFDYRNGIVTFTSAGLTALGYPGGLPASAVVSIAGNPTYMAPEVTIRKLFIEKANWSPAFINVQTSNVLLPQFDAAGKTLWDCVKLIAEMTNPRFVNWIIWADENGVIRFYEGKIDSPPVKSYINGKNMFNATYEHTSKQLRTLVRADGETSNSDGTQAIAAIAFDVRAVNKYGLTEPLTLSTDVTSGVRHLGPTQAVSELTMLCASALKQVSRPILNLNAEVYPDYSLQISDKVWVYDPKIGMDREYSVKGLTNEGSIAQSKQMLQLQEFYETINFSLGIGNAVVAEGNYTAATQAPPTANIVGAIRLGSGAGTYVYQNGDYVANDTTGDPITAFWTPNDNTPMHFDFFLNSAQAGQQVGTSSVWNHNNLPPGYGWVAQKNNVGDTVYYGTVPTPAPATGGTPTETVYVGIDDIFYMFNHPGPITPSDLTSTWSPTGNVTSPANGGPQPYTGLASKCYVWTWWYLCLDSNYGSGPSNRPIMRVTPKLEGVAQNVPATGGLWVTQNWGAAPGPAYNTGAYSANGASLAALFSGTGTGGVTKLYGNVAVNITDYTNPPPGFVGANVIGDGVNIGCAWGADAPADMIYVNYLKRTKGHYCILACNDQGARQFLRLPFWLSM